MKRIMRSTLTLLCVGAIAGCGSEKKSGTTTVDTSSIFKDQSLTTNQKAEKLAMAAEQLATPTGFMYADIVLDQALEQDPENKKAQFYKALLAQQMVLKGILTRIKPFANSSEKYKQQYEEAIKNLPNSGLKTFMFDGKEDIKTEKDAQVFIDQIYEAQGKFRKFLKANKDISLTLNLNDWVAPSSIEKSMYDCAANEKSVGVYEIKNCDLSRSLEVKLNRADVEALQHITAGMQIYLALLNSYDLSGSVAVSEKSDTKDYSNSMVWSELTKNSSFGKLRNSGTALKSIITMGNDAVAGVRWANKLKEELCPKGEEAENRPGYLFSGGICVPQQSNDPVENQSKLETVLKSVELALAGQAVEGLTDDKGGQIEVRPAAIFTNPIKDLKTLRPLFNSCDQVQSVADNTLGGVFPRGDVNQILYNSSECK